MLLPRGGLAEGEEQPLSRDQQIRLNFCEASELEAIPGIGPTLAKAIVDYRLARGPYTSLSELNEVPGIGAKKLGTLARHVRLD